MNTDLEHNRSELLEIVGRLSADFVTLAAATADSTPVPATPGWSVHDVVAHMTAVVPLYGLGPRGEAPVVDDPADLPELNERLKHEHDSTPTAQLIDTIRAETEVLVEQIASYGPAPPTFRFNGGEQIRADRALGLLAGEFAIHGHDIADATGAPWSIDPRHVEFVFAAMEDVLPGFVDPRHAAHHTATYDIHLRRGSRHLWSIRDGHVDCDAEPQAGRVDCRISGDPEALLLVMYGRLSPWRAALTGKVFAWGRRPWLALSLADRFHNP